MEFNRPINETKADHSLPAFEALDELAIKVSRVELASASFGDVEAEIPKIGKEVLRQLAQGYLNQRRRG